MNRTKPISLREFIKVINGGRELTAHEESLVVAAEKAAAAKAAKRQPVAMSIGSTADVTGDRIAGRGVDSIVIIDDPKPTILLAGCSHANVDRGDEFNPDRCRDCFAPVWPS